MTRVASLLLLLSLFVIPHTALAADGVPIDVSGGYSYLHDQDASSNFPGGLTGSVSAALNSRLGVVGELAGSYQTPTTPSTGATSHIDSFLGGARYTAYSAGKMSVFGQALIGAARSSLSVDSTVSPETDGCEALDSPRDHGNRFAALRSLCVTPVTASHCSGVRR